MSIVVQLTLKATDEGYEVLCGAMKQSLPDTAAREGAELISCAADPETKTIVVWELWDKKESQESYLAWRNEQGGMEAMGALLREPPVFTDMDHIF